MITEDYVSFEVAKLLKDKGFDVVCMTKYRPDGNLGFWTTDDLEAPTLHRVMKWLREVHNLFIFPFPQMNTNKFWTEIYQLNDNQEWENLYCNELELKNFSSYEDAAEAAIKYCLEYLVNKKESNH